MSTADSRAAVLAGVVAATILGGAPFKLIAAGPPVPIVVELFTSEGCSSCPPADALLQKLLDTQPLAGAQIIGLGEHVDYWDHQGWKDRFSSAALTNRQQVYGARFNNDSVYTPQMVVDGRAELVGSDAGAARKALERAQTVAHGIVRIEFDDRGATGGASARAIAVKITASELPRAGNDRADVIVAVTEDRLRSDVTRGENHGRVLAHAAVVRYLAPAGEAVRETPTTVHAEIPVAADWQRAQLKVVAFVQERRNRAILAAAVLPVDAR
ncbi:MAG TPA: DUF1223 domain-containing protein [Vicinamibacterales bacterium]|jgi:hypothetical protein